MANEFKIKKGLIVKGSEGKIVDVQGSTNELLSITDTSIGSLFSVNDLSGIPLIEVFDDNKIEVGNFNALEDFQLILKGDITANLLKKSGGTASQFLKADGSVETGNLNQLPSYTVSNLPAGTQGQLAYVTDGATVSYRANATGGGTSIALVFFDGTNWIYH